MATRATSVQITMPQMGESVTEGTVLGWLKQVGDRVEADEPLVEISTDKVDAEIPAPTAGTLVKILAEADETVQVGSVLGEIEPDDGDGAAPAAAAPRRLPPTRRTRPRPRAEPVDVTFPEMGDSVAEGTVLEWRVKVGDSVAVDDPLVEISTDKVDAEVPSPVAGTITEILVEADQTDPGGLGALPYRTRSGRLERLRPAEGGDHRGEARRGSVRDQWRQRHPRRRPHRERARAGCERHHRIRPARAGSRRKTSSPPSRAMARRARAQPSSPSAAPRRRS